MRIFKRYYYTIARKFVLSFFVYFFCLFFFYFFFYMVFRAPEAFRRLPGARGVIFPKYEPVASHGDPFQIQNYLIW